MEIEVGEYVRTKKKGIFKVLSIRKTPYGYYCGTVDNDKIKTFTIGKGGSAEIKNDIVKHSKNIIDLIEVGDYVNGCKVYKIEKNLITVCQEVGQVGQEIDYNYILSNEVQTIVTKEQFKEMEYRV